MKKGFLKEKRRAAFGWLAKALLASPFAVAAAFAAAFGAPEASAAEIATGTVMVSTGNGLVTEFTQTGTVITQLDTTTGSFVTAGSAFDSVGNFFVTDPDANKLSKFDPSGALLAASFAGPFDGRPVSIVFDAAGNFYVSQPADRTILKFDPSGKLLATFTPSPGPQVGGAPGFIDLGADQCTLYYTALYSVQRFRRIDV